jgi:hypothetical protein
MVEDKMAVWGVERIVKVTYLAVQNGQNIAMQWAILEEIFGNYDCM